MTTMCLLSAHSLFRTLARETVNPTDLSTRISREVFAENAGSSYLTCMVLRIDVAHRTLIDVNAGHPAGLMVGRSGHRLLLRGGRRAGLFAKTADEAEVVSFEAGDPGVIVTDGITEALEEDGIPAADILNRGVSRIPKPRTPERMCEASMAVAQRISGPRGVANWQEDQMVFAFLFEGHGSSAA